MARPRKITKEVKQKLEEAFANGLSDAEACVYADISKPTLYDYCKLHPDFNERKELLKESVKMHAKLNIARIIKDGDVENSKYYLERKCKDEFGVKQEIKFDGSLNNPFAGLTSDELRLLIKNEQNN